MKVEEGESIGPTWGSAVTKNGSYPIMNGISTLHQLWLHSVEQFGDKEYLGYRSVGATGALPYQWVTYQETAVKVQDLASAFRFVGATRSARVGVYGANAPECMMTSHVRCALLFKLYSLLRPANSCANTAERRVECRRATGKDFIASLCVRST